MNENDMKELTDRQQVQTQYSRTEYMWVTFQFEGFHCHPNADRSVYFLKEMHRHMFHVRAEIEIIEEESIDQISFKNMLQYHCQNHDMNNLTCEEICQELFGAIVKHYNLLRIRDLGTPTRRILIDVSEDGECGAVRAYYPSNMIVDNSWF